MNLILELVKMLLPLGPHSDNAIICHISVQYDYHIVEDKNHYSHETQDMDLLEIVEARYQNASTIFCTQFAPGGWHEKIGEVTLGSNNYGVITNNIKTTPRPIKVSP